MSEIQKVVNAPGIRLCWVISCRMECTAVGTHQFRHVATGHFGMSQQFESSYHSIVSHGTTLYDDFSSKVLVTMKFQYFIKTVLDNRIRDSGRNISHRSPLSENLLYLGIHEDRTAGTQVARSFRLAGKFGEITYRISHVIGKSLYEGSATGRACLVEFHSNYSTFFYEDSLHVLSANIKDETDVRHE